jgi:hypothetical protein
MREPCPIFFTRGESGLEAHSPRVKIIYNIIYQLSKYKKSVSFPSAKNQSAFQVQKISQLSKCKKISFPSAKKFSSAKNFQVQTLDFKVQTLAFQVQT